MEITSEYIQKLKAEKWFRGDLKHVLHSGQRILNNAFLESKGQLFVGNIARQFGKSFWAVSKAIELAIKKPNARIKYGTAFQTDLSEFILPTFSAVLESCPKSLRPVYKVQGSKWVFHNGAEIKLVGLDKSPNSLRGNVIDLIIIDEAGFVTNIEYLYKSVIIPATLHRPNCRIILISTPPSTPAHPFGDFIQMASQDGSYVELDIYKNPRITEEDIERMAKAMGGRNSTTFLRECMCKLVVDEALSIIPEWKDDFIGELPKDDYNAYYHRYVGMDLGVKDFTALIFGYYDFRQTKLFIEDELTMSGPKLTTISLKNELLLIERKLWGDKKPYRRISDNNNLMLIQDLGMLHDTYFIPTSKDTLEAMINEVRMFVHEGRLIVHPKCKQLIGCLKYGIWDEKHKMFSRSSTYGHFDHLAALVYLIRNLDKNTNPIPSTHNMAMSTHYISPEQEKNTNKNLNTLKDLFTAKRK